MIGSLLVTGALLKVGVTSGMMLSRGTDADAYPGDESGVMGEYRVPVREELKPFATFSSHLTEIDNPKDPKRFVFQLPPELVGTLLSVTMNRESDGKWAGPNASADCKNENQAWVCQVQFKNLPIDSEAVRSFITNKFPDLREASARLEVAREFSTEPIGILSYRYLSSY